MLATELLAIRLLIPFVGSGTEVISITISAVLLPLAIGYHKGSKAFHREYSRAIKAGRRPKTLREVLVKNILTVMVMLCFGLSYFFLDLFFEIFRSLGVVSPLIKTALYGAVFLVYPVYLLGQTIPIVSNYFSRNSLSEATGMMLFFSTLGSFLGSVFSTLILMMTVGVNNTVIVTMAMLFLAVLLVKKKPTFEVFFAASLVIFTFLLNQDSLFNKNKIYSNNAYSTIQVKDTAVPGERIMYVNKSPSSKIGDDASSRFQYIAYIEDNFIYTYKETEPLKILVIGAGGFTLGAHDRKNEYTFVDIDPDIKHVSEDYFLKSKLGRNKKFYASSARSFLQNNKDKYDLIVIDAYTNLLSIPSECVTVEFFREVKEKLQGEGVVIANFIGSASFRDKFAIRLYNTFNEVFPTFTRHIIGDYSPWRGTEEPLLNNLYIYINREDINDKAVYSDDLNTHSLDKY